ncbi:tryptophan--tRNA ligase [Leptospira sp. GIMC2001]|uniref:tryptophan--tRNA ligase n=1 Tax=Leptospira sp. GIMC2001 TaxID=1513297 RepID=UPI00234A0913|nr:tryptophan--tRNA ligase [Leptospira sp. GIMC2001]WCL50407.1 tryptophan--tRNA ligase [Leptospira sp. GIMC2001]
MRVLTGIQSSGKLHLGNYFSAIQKMLSYQSKENLFLFVANLHSLTTFKDKKIQWENTRNAVLDLLALGIDPNKTVFWIQSDVPEVTEITWYLSMAIITSQLSLAHSFKDKTARGITPTAALYNYPILMAADILAFQAEKVPVGKDQKQHLEFARDIAIRFNTTYGEVFTIPEPDIEEGTALVPGIDGAKMSKSYGNTINFFDSEKEIKKAVMSIVSDSAGIDEAKDPDKSVLYAIYSLFLSKDDKLLLADRFRTPGLRYGDVKKELLEKILEHFADFRTKRLSLQNDPDYVREVLASGKAKAKSYIDPTLEKIRENLGELKFF